MKVGSGAGSRSALFFGERIAAPRTSAIAETDGGAPPGAVLTGEASSTSGAEGALLER